MMQKWTAEQNEAISSRGKNLLVSAAAGSGKTAVLVERILKLVVEDQIDIDKLLIVTFTNAAAAEMRERISEVLSRELEKGDENEANLRNQITLLNKASISTLHSFCIQILRKYFYVLGIDPVFKIGDQAELLLLRRIALEEILEKAYEEKNPGFIELIEAYTENKGDKRIEDLIFSVYFFIQSQPYPFNWLKEKITDFQIDEDGFLKSSWIKVIKKSLQIEFEGVSNLLEEAIAIAELPGGPEPYIEALLSDKKMINEMQRKIDEYFAGNEELANICFSPKKLKSIKKDDCVDEYLREQVKKLREDYKKIIVDLLKKDVLSKDWAYFLEDINKLYPRLAALFNLVENLSEVYQNKKLEKGLLDFNDLEHYALKILEHENIAEAYKNYYEYIFVDEYQDSNIVQETIINKICRKNNLFFVGDVKQSIYRFRLADPSLFIDKYLKYNSKEIEFNKRIDLSKNFRSREQILDGVNYLFQQIMSKELGEIDYNKEAKLYTGVDYKDIYDSKIEINFIEKGMDNISAEEENTEISESELKDITDAEGEAYFIADKIKELIGKETYDIKVKSYRKINYRDIVILLRSAKNWSGIFNEILTKEGIPVYVDDSQGYFDTLEIRIFMNLLSIIDNKQNDIPLLSVMRSPIGDFSTEELLKVRSSFSKSSFFDAMEMYVNEYRDDLAKKLSDFINYLDSWSEKARYKRLDEFLWELMIQSGYYYYVGAMVKGAQRQANLKILVDRATQFEKGTVSGLFNFIKFAEQFQKASGDMGSAKIIGENEDVVRIMTVHKSKGLEFPVVIAAAFGRQFNLMDLKGDLLLHKDLGLGPKFVDTGNRTYRESLPQLAIKRITRIENLSEEMRVLYVALTRAKDKLIICGTINDLSKNIISWTRRNNNYELLKSKSYLEWLGRCLIRHPDGKLLRDYLENEFPENLIVADPSVWGINIHSKNSILKDSLEKNISKKELKEKLINFTSNAESDLDKEIRKRFIWEYPGGNSKKIPSKLAVSDLNKVSIKDIERLMIKAPSFSKKPLFLEKEKKFTGSEKGTIIHFYMQNCNIKQDFTIESIQEEIEGMVKRELLTKEEAKVIPPEKVLRFFESDLGRRMIKSKKVCREESFVFQLKASEAIRDLSDSKEIVYIQGIIDCYFEEDEDLILIDYKTDFLEETEEEFIAKYASQLKIYREALEKIKEKQVREAYLYSFSLDKEILQV